MNNVTSKSRVRGTLVINADDFGANIETTDRIINCLEKGLVTSATIMANMPDFERSAARVKALGFEQQIGVHLNLDEGPALSPHMRRLSSDGNLFCGRQLFHWNRDFVRAIEAELCAQVQRVVDAGIVLTHFDSHHHLHTHFSNTRVVLRVARRFGIRYLRLAGNLYFPPSSIKRWYRSVINHMIRRAGFAGTDYFTFVDYFLPHAPDLGAKTTVELMVHPGVDKDYALLNSERYREFLSHYRLKSYKNIDS